MHIDRPNKKIQASDEISSKSELEDALKAALTDDLCVELVDLAYSEDGEFADDAFIDSDTFFDLLANEEPYEVARQFFMGEDLDSKGPANPTRDYFRYNGYGNVESTDDPGATYSEILDTEIVDYIMDHLDDRDYPEEIQELIDEYLGNEE